MLKNHFYVIMDVLGYKAIERHVGKNNQNIVFTGSADSEMSEEQKKEKLSELRKKEQEIQDILAKKTKELKKICLREAVRICFVCSVAIFCKAHFVSSTLLNRVAVW